MSDIQELRWAISNLKTTIAELQEDLADAEAELAEEIRLENQIINLIDDCV